MIWQSVNCGTEEQGQQGWHVKGRRRMFVAFPSTSRLRNDEHHVVTKPPPSPSPSPLPLPSPPPRGLLTQQKDREPSGLSKQAIRRFGGYSGVKVCFARGDSEAKTYDVDSVIKTCHISFNGKSDLELSEALSSCHCSLDVRDCSPLSLSEFAQAAGVETLGGKNTSSPCF